MRLTPPTRLLIAFFVLARLAFANDAAEPQRILFLGDSLTAGYGIDPRKAYPNLIAQKIEAADLPYEVVPLGLSGETSAGGLRRANWVMQRPFSVLVIALGSNDGLRGIDLADTRKNLQSLIDTARSKNPNVTIVIAGMQIPPNLGEAYTSQFKSLYSDLAETNDIVFIPFLLDGVGGNPALNIEDGIHPNAAGHRIVAETVWDVLKPVLSEPQSPEAEG